MKQLQQECRVRDPALKGILGKNKQWLLDHLGIGSVWISLPETIAEETSVQKVVAPNQCNEKKRSAESATIKETPSKKKLKANKTKADKLKEGIDMNYIKSLPRITSSLTIAQLNHELHHRNPSTTGTSNKNKQWFLDQLGFGSIWMSSMEAKNLDAKEMPRISSSLTIAQLLHELLERIPNQTGTSGRKKEWYLERLRLGTVWITGGGSGANEK